MITIFLVSFLLFFIVVEGKCPQGHVCCKSYCVEVDLFDEAVDCIKKFEGWHTEKHYPYVGYGHRLLPKDNFNHNISEEFADSLLRADLRQKCSVFRAYGKDSLLLGVLAYNVGEYRLLGSGNKPPCKLIRKLDAGDRDIYNEYCSFRMYQGKVLPSLEARRAYEFELLFDKTKTRINKE